MGLPPKWIDDGVPGPGAYIKKLDTNTGPWYTIPCKKETPRTTSQDTPGAGAYNPFPKVSCLNIDI